MATQNFCSFHGSIMLESQMAIPTQLQQDVTASNILQCDFPCPGVPAESEIHYQMSYRNEDGFQFLAGAMAQRTQSSSLNITRTVSPTSPFFPGCSDLNQEIRKTMTTWTGCPRFLIRTSRQPDLWWQFPIVPTNVEFLL